MGISSDRLARLTARKAGHAYEIETSSEKNNHLEKRKKVQLGAIE